MSKKPKHPLSRAEVTGIVKRFMKPEQYQARRDIMLFYKVFAEFPDAEFWKAYQLDFQLNCIAWFLSAAGRERIKTDLALFHLDIPSNQQYDMQETKVGDDVFVNRSKPTVADLFKL